MLGDVIQALVRGLPRLQQLDITPGAIYKLKARYPGEIERKVLAEAEAAGVELRPLFEE